MRIHLRAITCPYFRSTHIRYDVLVTQLGWYNVCQAWASYQIRKIAGCACAGNAGNVFPSRRFQRKPLVSDPGMHHGTCVTHVPWCMSGSLTCGDGENVPGIPGACAPAILRIWQEAHGSIFMIAIVQIRYILYACAQYAKREYKLEMQTEWYMQNPKMQWCAGRS